MFKKLLHRDIDERLQSRLDMISGLFEQPEALLSGDQADPPEQLAAVGFAATAEADSAATPETEDDALTLTEPWPTFENGEYEVQPALLRRSDEIAGADSGGGLLSRLRSKRDSASERPPRAIPPAPDFYDDGDEPLALTVRHRHLPPPDSADADDARPASVVMIPSALPSMSNRPVEPGHTDDADSPARLPSEPALVLRLTPPAMVEDAEDTVPVEDIPAVAELTVPEHFDAAEAPAAPAPGASMEIDPGFAAIAGAAVLDPGSSQTPDAVGPESSEASIEEPAEAAPADLEEAEAVGGETPEPEPAGIEEAPGEPEAATPETTPETPPAPLTQARGSEARSRGVLPIDGLDSYIDEPFKPGTGFTPVVAIISGGDRFVLRTARLTLEDAEQSGRRLTVAWFHSAPQALPLPDDADGSAGAKRAARMLGFVVNALRDEQFVGDIVAYGGFDPDSADARLATWILDLVFVAADDLVGHGIEEDVNSNGQLPSPDKLMQAAFVEWSGGPRKSEDHSQAFARLTAAREPDHLSVAPQAGRENGPGTAHSRRIGFAS